MKFKHLKEPRCVYRCVIVYIAKEIFMQCKSFSTSFDMELKYLCFSHPTKH